MTGLSYVWSGLRRRPGQTVGAVLAIALAVAFLASLGSFVAQSHARLTQRAAQQVLVDWQVQTVPGADLAAVAAAVQALPDVLGVRPVDYAKVPALSSGGRRTGQAYVVSLPADYPSFAPGELRPLLGSTSGPVLQQQTAANLAAAPGSTVQVLLPGGAQSVTVGGVTDLPAAGTFFQVVGAAAGTTPAAPPDNVLLVPPGQFAQLSAGVPVLHQLHVRFRHDTLPADPAAASALLTQRVNAFSASVTGNALVGNSLGAALSSARQDAIYTRLLVLLLGVPAVVLAALVAALVVALRTDRQRRDLGLLRLRGATPGRSLALVGVTAVLDGLLGAALGVGAGALASRLAFGPGAGLSPGWTATAAVGGLLLALVAELAPVARLLRQGAPTVQEAVTAAPSTRLPLPLRLGLDVVLLVASAIVFVLTSRGGYQVVVVPEGVPVASVNYAALLAPALLWPGAALLLWRLTSAALSAGRRVPKQDERGRIPDVRASVVRQRRRIVARGATGLGVAIAVTVSTAVFTATYDQQAALDVALTVGSDVAVTLPPDTLTGGLDPAAARSLSGVNAVAPVQHRLVYIGADLQDLYGVDAGTVGRAAPMQDAFTPGSTSQATFGRLQASHDGALVSQETLSDYQLHIGDLLRMRVSTGGGAYRTVPFHVAGVITEFATAPRDSFVVANRSYLAQVTGSSSVQTLLVKTDQPAAVAAALRPVVPAQASIADTVGAAATVTTASGLAATDLSGLARLTLTFGLLLALASGSLALLVGIAQRRRSLVILAVLGASVRQRVGFVWSETRALLLAGVLGGLAIGGVLAFELVRVLNGIFDPAPSRPVIPAVPVTGLVVAVVAVTSLAAVFGARRLGRFDAGRLRDL